ncbi:hypothetical protein CDIK_1463 [Cucumispora dikerogammari]|nr:hypothetical protein CDIK_1463 [Cucumispora dikerogammari]
MGAKEEFKLKLFSYKKQDTIRRNMLIMIAKSKEKDAEEIVKAIIYFKRLPDYAVQINDLISALSMKSETYKQLFEQIEDLNDKELCESSELCDNAGKTTNNKKRVKLNNSFNKINNSLNNVLKTIPYPPSYLLFNMVDKNMYKKQNKEFFTSENIIKRKKHLIDYKQKKIDFQQKHLTTISYKNNNKPLKTTSLNEINSTEIFNETKDDPNSIEKILNKIFKPLICFHCGKRFDKNKDEMFKFNCHLRNHENLIKETLFSEDYKNRKIRDFFPQIKSFEILYKNVNLCLPSIDDFDFKDDRVFVENRESVFCIKCGKSICLKKEGLKYLILDAKKVGVNVFAHKQCL